MGRHEWPAIQEKIGCTLKKRFDSFGDADTARWCLEAQEEYPIFVYDCRYCGGWHLTKNEPGLSPKRIRAYRARWRATLNEG